MAVCGPFVLLAFFLLLSFLPPFYHPCRSTYVSSTAVPLSAFPHILSYSERPLEHAPSQTYLCSQKAGRILPAAKRSVGSHALQVYSVSRKSECSGPALQSCKP